MRSFGQRKSGFTLVELAVVLVIVGLLLGGMIVSLGTQQDLSNARETEKRLGDIREALLGFAMANGRLPCPAAPPPAGGSESPTGSGACDNALNGYVPASLLGIAPADAQGYALDAWNNPIRYAIYATPIAPLPSPPFTTPGAMKSIGIDKIALSGSNTRTFIYVCGSATGIGTSDCGAASKITDSAIAVIYSTGKNGLDEARAGRDDSVFVSAPSMTADDQVTWISPNILFNRMIAAGRLP